MKLRTLSDGDLDIIIEAKMKAPYSTLKRPVSIENETAKIVAVTSQLTCTQNGRLYKGYHLYLLADVGEAESE